jgi:hypothetical protein
VYDLATRLGAQAAQGDAFVSIVQHGRMKRALGTDTWMSFTARQSIDLQACNFAWRARFATLGLVGVRDALQDGVGRLDVTALGFIPLIRTPRTTALVRGELMRYLAELAWAPDAILQNPALRWREASAGSLMVAAGEGETEAEILLGLDDAGRIATAYAHDRPRSAIDPILPTPWRGRFGNYRLHRGRWVPFSGEVAWVIDGREEIYFQGKIESWSTHGD